MPPSPKDVLVGLFDALAREGSAPDVLARFCRDEELAAFLGRLLAGFPDARPVLRDLLADADKVLVLFELRGPGQEPPPGVAFLCRVADGRILDYWPIPEMSDLL
jgi:ketosteroid isomerase-like protein